MNFKPYSQIIGQLCLQLALIGWWGAASAVEDRDYFIQGKPASRTAYQGVSLVNEAVLLMRSNKNQEAVGKLLEAEKLAPEIPEVHHNLGLALAKVGRLPEAIEELKTALTMRDNIDSTWLTLGGLYQSIGQLDQAIKTYQEFLKRFPNNSEAHKITNLVKGLQGERQKQLNLSLFGVNSPDDYYGDVTAQGKLRWPSTRMPLRIYLAPGDGVYAYQPNFEGILRQAFTDWQEISAGRIKFAFTNDPKQADIECSWTSDARKFSNSAEAGETRVYTNHVGITRGTVKLLTVPLSPDLPLTDNRLRVICLHEIGHVLGLAGHTTNPDDIMFYSSSIVDRHRDLSVRDGNTIIHLYTSKFDLAPTNQKSAVNE
jgi:tetratricopeptide (TPR) repeat protein